MVTKKRRQAQSVSNETNLTINIRRTAVSLAVAAALPGAMIMSASAYAQEAAGAEDEQVMEEIVSYGKFRKSLIDAISTKRDSTTIVEAISAEDIGKLPDSSIAESLARLPGLAGERRNGRTSGLSVRGFKEDYVGTMLNGREVLGIGDNRGVEYDLYPSEIMSGVVVYKTPDATLTTQGIGGTVDLRTIRPLDATPYIAANASYEQNDLDSANPDFDDNGHRLALSFSDIFADDTVGVALAIASTESPSQEQQFRGWGYDSVDIAAPTGPGVTLDGTEKILGGQDSFARSAVFERDTISGILQFAPNDDLTLTFDGLYIDYQETKALRGIEEFLAGGAVINAVVDGLVTEADLPGFRTVIRNDGERTDAELTTFGLNAEYLVNDDWTLTFDASYGESKKDIANFESYSGVGRPGQIAGQGPASARSYTWTPTGPVFGDHPTLPNVDLSDYDSILLAGPQSWGGGMNAIPTWQPTLAEPGVGPGQAQDGFINYRTFDEDLTTLKLQLSRPLDTGIFTGIDFGIQYSDRTKSQVKEGAWLTAPTWPNHGPVPDEFRLGATDLSFLGPNVGSMIAYDGLGLVESGYYVQTASSQLLPDDQGASYQVDEQLITAYAKLDFDTQWGGVGVSGNFGLQIVDVDQEGSGFDAFTGDDLFVTAIPLKDGDTYTDVLPSLNLNFDLDDGHLIRAAVSKTISRPKMNDMRPNRVISFSSNVVDIAGTTAETGPWSGSSGNSLLKPLEANQLDLAYDWYYADDGFLSAAFFYKDLTNWHRSSSITTDFTPFYIPGFHEGDDGMGNIVTPGTFLGNISNLEDGLEGFVRGYEFQANVPGHIIHDALEGFGILASAALADGKLDDGGNVPGLSEENYQLTLYYEVGGFQARLSGTKRDKFSTEVRGFSLNLENTFDQGAELLDAQISYDFGLGGFEKLDGLSIALQAQNLTDEDTLLTNDDSREVTKYQTFGSNYLLSLFYKFQ